MCVTVGKTTLNVVVHVFFGRKTTVEFIRVVKITLYPLPHWPPPKNGKIALAHCLTRRMSVHQLFGIGTMDK